MKPIKVYQYVLLPTCLDKYNTVVQVHFFNEALLTNLFSFFMIVVNKDTRLFC